MEEKRKRISIITGVVILLIIVLVAVVVFVLSLNKNETSNKENVDSISSNISNAIKDIPGEEYTKTEDGAKINISDALQSNKQIGDFTLSNFYIYSVDGLTRIEYDVLNDSNFRQSLGKFKFLVYTDTEKVGEISCTGDELAAGQVKRMSVTVNFDIANLYDLVVEEVYTQEM